MEKMSLIYVEKTGHVLGAFTRTSDSESEPAAEAVVGTALLLRDPDSGKQLFGVGSQHLKVKNVDRNDDVILSHRDYVLEDDAPAEKGALVFASVVKYTKPTLTIELTTSPAEDIKVLVQIEDGTSQPVLVTVDVAPDTTPPATGTATVTLAPGTYNTLALVPGYRALIGSIVVP